MYLCAELLNDACVSWVEHKSLFALSIADGLTIGGGFFLCSATAWGANALFRFILNKL